MKKILIILLLPLQLLAQPFSKNEIIKWQQQAKSVTIIRDNWGIPHVYGKTDADAVFGLLYAQCEDDFKRVEMNYIEKLGRLAEINGKQDIYNDLLIRLIIDTTDAISDYNKSPVWLKKLMNAYADGINYYLFKHPQTKPRLLHRFQPWYPLLWTDGSIGAISTGDVNVDEVEKFYAGNDVSVMPWVLDDEENLTGSNGFAIAPSKTASGHALLYINPHVTFYFRPEVHVVSDEGLNTYGAVTWGQFFVYQGFNEHCGWMHTSSSVDVADVYAEKVSQKNGKWVYQYNNTERPMSSKKINISYTDEGKIKMKSITAYYTHHGPVMAKRNDAWLSVKANNRNMNGLVQSWQRTKAKSFAEYKKTMDLLVNTSNNTVYADAEGNIAYWHGNFIPKRDPKYDWSKPVDGSTPATEWKGLHSVNESVHLYNPVNGWLQNCNSTPFTVAGINSPKKENYPRYMAPDGENFRGINAVRVLQKQNAYTLDKLIAAGYDTYLAAFEPLIPALTKAGNQRNTKDSSQEDLNEAITLLQNWDMRVSETSVATTIAIGWAQRLLPAISRAALDDVEADQVVRTKRFAASATAADLLEPLQAEISELKQNFGKWKMPWGEINRFQRISTDINQQYNDDAPSLPVAFASSAWGMLPSYTSRYYPGTKKRYGVNGNSFICAVEFGKKIKAKSLLAGGENGDPASAHFKDQAEMYTKGMFKDVLFYKEDVLKHAEKTYHPGE